MKKKSSTKNPAKQGAKTGRKAERVAAKPDEVPAVGENISTDLLYKSRSHLRQIQKIAKIASWELDLISGNLTWSDEVFSIFNIPRGTSLSYIDFLQFILPEDREYVKQKWKDALGGAPYDIEHRILTGEGIKWLREKATLEFDKTGRAVRGVGIAQDITAQKTAEKELLRTKINYRMIADYTYDWEWWTNINGTFRYVSPACERITGYKANRFIENDGLLREIIVPEDRAKWDKHDNESNIDIGLREMQFRIKRPNGEIRWIEHACQPVFTREKEFMGFRASNRDITERKQAENALRENATLLELATAATRIGQWSWNLKTNEVYFSPEWKRQIGYEEHEIPNVYETWESRLHPDDLQQTINSLEDYLSGAQDKYKVEFRLMHKDGSYRWIYTRAEKQFDNKGELDKILGCHLDITESREAQEALQLSQKTLEKAQEVAHIGSWHLDLLDNNLVWSDENYKIFGIPKGTPMTYENFIRTVHPEDRNYVDEKWLAAIEGKPYDIEYRLLIDNKVKWVREKAELNYDHNGKPTSGVGITQDITERKLADKTLRNSRKRLVKAEKVARMGFLDWNLKTNETILSGEVYNLYGLDPKMPATLEQIMNMIHPDDLKYVEENLNWAIDGSHDYDIDHRIIRPDGKVIWVHARADRELDREGRLVSLIGTVVDITERKLAEQAIKKTEEELRLLSGQLMSAEERERKRIASDIHDTIGQALSAVKFSVENSLAAINKKSFSAASRSLESIVPLTQQTIEEVRRIIMDLRPSTLDDLGLIATISWLFREFASIYSHISIEKEIHLEETDIPLSLKSVIYRILQEALNNAAKHSQTESLRLRLIKNDDSLEFLFEDSGVGFDLDTVQSKTSDQEGMGLSSMRERAQMSGGAFAIQTRPGVGTSIHVFWPINVNGIARE